MFIVNQPSSVVALGADLVKAFWAAPSGQNWANNFTYSSGLEVRNGSGFYTTANGYTLVKNVNTLEGKFSLVTPLTSGNYTFNVPSGAISDSSGNLASSSGYPFNYL
jgi:P pilus assembly chaperone PapD